ncbi:hypothetical protein GGTG_02167 [Gaeumannomyces tritici R3-111a-1]|uniref:Uncharacterized protein n=1 Tax=Gaeumannomyces tritici (strain R3-111a-1) TaxID=644352 RepID=J3NLL8_GAET3|nr:hypothetical protein GGTG_02167 [Gaeumannomyces tritici R3-111a-1]EJT82193.1 hypothetical protein GGTG_02167 [Gaeumannomyces tritici R3-111a-1]
MSGVQPACYPRLLSPRDNDLTRAEATQPGWSGQKRQADSLNLTPPYYYCHKNRRGYIWPPPGVALCSVPVTNPPAKVKNMHSGRQALAAPR